MSGINLQDPPEMSNQMLKEFKTHQYKTDDIVSDNEDDYDIRKLEKKSGSKDKKKGVPQENKSCKCNIF